MPKYITPLCLLPYFTNNKLNEGLSLLIDGDRYHTMDIINTTASFDNGKFITDADKLFRYEVDVIDETGWVLHNHDCIAE
jgi:hypothetical protein